MDRNFARALSLVLKSEGGWSDNPKDPGGATMKGVTLATFRRFIKPSGTKADLRAITDEQLATVYRREFWDTVHGAELPDGVDYAVFDFSVNSGPDRAAKYLQGVAGVTADGRLGPESMKAINAKPPGVIVDALCDSRLAFMKRAKDKKTGKLLWPTFGKGWTSRMVDVRRDALLMTAAPAQPAPAPKPTPLPPAAPVPVPPASPPVPEPASPVVGKAPGVIALIIVALGSAAAWFAHLPCNIFGVFCQ